MLGLGLMGSLQALVTHLHIQHLPHILYDKIPLVDITGRFQAPPTSARVEWNGVGTLALSHLLVVAEQPDRAGLGVALDMDGPVDADRVVITRTFWCTLTRE